VTSGILIADGHEGRARRIGQACSRRGLRARYAHSGAAALEQALAEIPDLVVASPDLPLIDAAKLGDILAANPRTQSVRFLFLARGPGQQRSRGGFDESLPPSTDPEEIALRLESMLAQRERMEAVERDARARHEVQGKLSQIPLVDLLQLFHMNRRTGTLDLSRREAGGGEERGSVGIRDGNIVHASAGPSVSGEKALFRLLAWSDGSFAFTPNPVQGAPRILAPTRALLMEGMRQLDEWNRLHGSLPPAEARVVRSVSREELPQAVHPVTQEVLRLLEIYDRVGDLVDHCSYPDYQVLRTLQTLVERGLVQLRREAPRSTAPAPVELFESAQIRRLRDWLEAGRPRGTSPAEAKLLLLSPDLEATRDFVRLLAALPGVQPSPALQRPEFSAEDIEVVARLAVEEGLGIELIHVPADERYAPVWPVLAHGSLGALLLLSSPVAEAEQALQPVIETLRELPRARLFHVLLLRKGERVAPRELHAKLSLLDRASLFLVPLEGKDPVSLLRTMLTRVMP